MMSKGVDFVVKSVREYDENGESKTRWTDIGVAFTNKDSITILLNALPLGEKMVLMKPKPRDEKKSMDPFDVH